MGWNPAFTVIQPPHSQFESRIIMVFRLTIQQPRMPAIYGRSLADARERKELFTPE
jgi:hypothetical protein